MTTTEKRQLVREISQVRSSEKDGKRYLEGYATEFEVETKLGRGDWAWTEVVKRGAFTTSLAEQPSIKLLHSHDTGRVIASRRNRDGKVTGTLELREDERGLWFRAEIPDTQEGRDLITQVERGDLDGMSFGFDIIRETWDENKRASEIEEVRLYEISVVAFPAYDQAQFDLVVRSGRVEKPKDTGGAAYAGLVVALMQEQDLT
jgi:HK97 family phage prohead protease